MKMEKIWEFFSDVKNIFPKKIHKILVLGKDTQAANFRYFSQLEYHPKGPVVVLVILEQTSPLLPLTSFSDADRSRQALVMAQVYGLLWEGR